MTTPCPHRPPCTACPRFGEPGLAPVAHALLRTLADQHGLHGVEVVEGPLHAFRLRARLAIRGRQNSPKIGLFEGGSHRVVHVPRCPIQHPLINRTADTVRRALVDTRTPCYSDSAHLGFARYLQVVVERRSQTAQVVLVANAAPGAPPATLMERIQDRMGNELHSLWFNSHEATGNAILGPHFMHWTGPQNVQECFGGATVYYGPGAFGQSNLAMAEQIVERIRAEVGTGTSIAEFYAGVGAIGLSLIDQADRLHLNEVSPAGLDGLRQGLAGLNGDARARVHLFPGTAGDALDAADDCEVIITDPPRKGLDTALSTRLAAMPPRLLLYVSCGVESLARDIAVLVAKRRLRLRSLTAFNQFPFTDHVETLACFERA